MKVVISLFKSSYYELSYPFIMIVNRFFRYCLKELVWYRAEKDTKKNMRFGFIAPTLDQYWDNNTDLNSQPQTNQN